MFSAECVPTRRNFLMTAAAIGAGIPSLAVIPQLAWSEESDINIIGPKKGFSSQIGTLVSMMTWMRMMMLSSVNGMTQKDLDFLIDNNANSIGALLLHLAEFRKRDDNWLMTVDKDWGWGPTNNYYNWFHVCEHESNHNGQIKFLKKRIPGAKSNSE